MRVPVHGLALPRHLGAAPLTGRARLLVAAAEQPEADHEAGQLHHRGDGSTIAAKAAMPTGSAV
jgi:hypothetical protein